MDAPIDQPVLGSRRISNYVVAVLVSIGGVGFLLTSASSYFGRDFLPIGHPADLIWVPQGLVMGAYGVGAVLLSSYLWAVIAIDVGGGRNLFDRGADTITIERRGFRRLISFTLPLVMCRL